MVRRPDREDVAIWWQHRRPDFDRCCLNQVRWCVSTIDPLICRDDVLLGSRMTGAIDSKNCLLRKLRPGLLARAGIVLVRCGRPRICNRVVNRAPAVEQVPEHHAPVRKCAGSRIANGCPAGRRGEHSPAVCDRIINFRREEVRLHSVVVLAACDKHPSVTKDGRCEVQWRIRTVSQCRPRAVHIITVDIRRKLPPLVSVGRIKGTESAASPRFKYNPTATRPDALWPSLPGS